VKKRILFVDDDPLVLGALQRMLHGMRQEWDMEFLGSGTLALERMGLAPFDVVVTDMRMPGMNGAELLEEVMRRYPKTIRIVLSGHTDKELILKCVNSTHQYLSKPCDSRTIKATVQRVCALQDAVENERVNHLVAQMGRLPSLPSIYAQIVEELNDPSSTIEEIGQIVNQDIAMTAQFLKLVNSAYFGLSHTVTSPAEAAMYLGIDTIKSLVLSIHTFSQFDDLNGRGFKLDALMHHSLRTAGRAGRIAKFERSNSRVVNECFIGGMLHDIGKLLLAANFPKDYEEVTRLVEEVGFASCVAEKQLFGVNHAGVGGYLLGLWGLPLPVVEAISLHHSPHDSADPAFGALTAVHAANVFEHESMPDFSPTADHVLDGPYLARLGLAHRVKEWRQNGQTTETKGGRS